MCGITGFIQKTENIETIQKMLDVQSYRGPDDSGTYYDYDTGVHFGHNRLSIQDLSSHGHQPFISNCHNYIIVFNGEIYNFQSIRKELEQKGHTFISNSDTEVILYSYKEWGIESIHRFIGMFAFAILDKVKNTLILVRDRAGVKPLYYYVDTQNFMFSSEIKSFHKHPNFQKKQNIQVLPYFFQFGYIPAPYTIFQDCYKLEAGHFLEYNLNSSTFNIQKYWDINHFYQKEKFSKNEDKIIEELEIILDDAIDLRMISDVPVGIFLSGGYDSSLVASILSKKQGKKIKTFTIGFDDPRFNEALDAKTIAEYLQTDHTEHYMSKSDILELIDQLPFYYDEPFGDSSALATIVVSKLAKQHITVALSADGGDETFFGYSKYFFLNRLKNIFAHKIQKMLLKIGFEIINQNTIAYFNDLLPKNLRQTNIKDKYLKFKRALNSNNLEEMFKNSSSYVDTKEINRFLKISNDQIGFSKWNKIDNIDFLDQMMAIDYKLFMNDDVLTKVDRATMSVSLEAREPLLDHRIIEFMARVPLDLKYKNHESKYLLRQILYRYLPKEMVDKPKSGFQIPLSDWLRTDLKPLIEKYLNFDTLDENIFNRTEIQALKKRFYRGEELGSAIWFILTYQMWKEKWLD